MALPGTFENLIASTFLKKDTEKSLVDKMLGKKDIEEIQILISKDNLTLEDLFKLLYMMSASEQKLLNYNEWERYIMLKFFVWIREFIMVLIYLRRYQEDINLKKNKTTDRAVKLLNDSVYEMEQGIKFLLDLYFNIGRTSLSVEAVGFRELLSNRFEVNYMKSKALDDPQKPKGWFGKGEE